MKKEKAALHIYRTREGSWKWMFINALGTPFVQTPDVADDETKKVVQAMTARMEGYSTPSECEKSFYRFCSMIGVPDPKALVEVKREPVNELMLACR